MKSKIFTFLLVFMSLTTLVSNASAATITAVATGNWSATATWDGGVVPSSTDSVVVPSGFTVTIDNAYATCQGVSIQDGGVLILSNNFYVCNISVNSGGKFYSSTSNSSNKALYWGVLNTNASYTTALTYTAQTGNYKITVDGTGQFGGTVAGTNDGVAIYYSEFATSLTFDGTSTTTKYIGRLIANNFVDNSTSTNFNLNIKQNLFMSLSSSGLGVSLQNNKKFVGTRTMTIYPGYKVSTNANARFHANNANPTAEQGNFVYNIFGTLDLGTAGYDFSIYTTSNVNSSTQDITVNVGNGSDYAVLKLGRGVTLRKYLATQNIAMNWNNPNSRIVFGGNGGITINSAGSYNGSAWIDDVTHFPTQIRNLVYENSGTAAGLTIPVKLSVTDTLYYYGNGNKLYAGAVIDATAKSATLGKLFNYNNNAYVVTAVTPAVTTVSNTTLGTLGTWVKGTTVTDAAGNSYYCDSVGIYAGVVKFMNATGGAEFTGGPIQVSGNVTSELNSGNTGRFSAAAYIGGNTVNGAGTMYFAKTSTVGGTFTNAGTVTLIGDISTGDIVNNGTFALSTKQLNLSGNVSGSNTIDASLGYVQYTGTLDRTISGFTGNAFGALKLNTTGTISLDGATTITGALTLTKGKLAIGNNDITPGSVIGGSATAYVVTNGTGKLTLTTADATAKLFPVGISSTSYDPVTVTPTTGTATAVKVSSTLSGTAVSGVKYNSAEWDITPAVASSTVLAFTPSVIDSQVAANTASPVIGHYVGGSYVNNNTVIYADGTFIGTFDSFSPFVTGANVGTTGLNNPSKFSIYTQNGSLYINGISANDQIAVYTINGQLVTKMQANGTQAQIALQPGVYVVRINTEVSKITL